MFCPSWPDFIRLQATPFITFSIQIQENVTNLVNNFILKEINKKIIRKLGIYNEYTINVWSALCRTSQRKHTKFSTEQVVTAEAGCAGLFYLSVSREDQSPGLPGVGTAS